MKRVGQVGEAPKFLSGWKEIASYLGKGVRTVQRYERELGFPVRRPAGKSHAGVIATRAEVDAWVAASPIREQFVLSIADTDSKAAVLENMRKSVETMGALRAQMQALRTELKVSVLDLRESITGICVDMNNRWLSDVHRNSPGILEEQDLDRDLDDDDFQLPKVI
jgi:hypothetical protein